MVKILVVGLGNPILTDDGVGVRVAAAVRSRLPDGRERYLDQSQPDRRDHEQLRPDVHVCQEGCSGFDKKGYRS